MLTPAIKRYQLHVDQSSLHHQRAGSSLPNTRTVTSFFSAKRLENVQDCMTGGDSSVVVHPPKKDWVVRGGYRRVFCQHLKIPKKYKKIQPKIQNQNCRVWKIQLVGFVFFFVFWFLISKSEHGVGSLAYFEFVFSLYFVFLKFWVRIFFVFCIFEIVDSYFFCIFVFLSNCIRIFLYFFALFFVKIQKNTKKYKWDTKKIHFVFLFFWYFSITSKNAICIFVFFL